VTWARKWRALAVVLTVTIGGLFAAAAQGDAGTVVVPKGGKVAGEGYAYYLGVQCSGISGLGNLGRWCAERSRFTASRLRFVRKWDVERAVTSRRPADLHRRRLKRVLDAPR